MLDLARLNRDTATRTERELTTPVDLCLPSGRLNPAAVGWSRQPLHRANLRGWGRNKRFEFWCIITDDFVLTANISHHDYRAMIASTFIDLKTGDVCATRENRWLPPRGILSALDRRAAMEAVGQNITVRLAPNAAGVAIDVTTRRSTVRLQVFDEPGRESMGVLVPWSDRLFQYTCKNNCMLVEGSVVVDGVERRITRGRGYAIHDHGRGRWPYDTRWNWAAASGDTNGRQIGLQFGAKWTAGTPSTENAVRIDGRLHKISQELIWTYDRSDWMAPWSIRGDRVDLMFTPTLYHRHAFDRWVISAHADQCFGHFDGEIVSDAGERVRVANVFGLAEEVHRRW